MAPTAYAWDHPAYRNEQGRKTLPRSYSETGRVMLTEAPHPRTADPHRTRDSQEPPVALTDRALPERRRPLGGP